MTSSDMDHMKFLSVIAADDLAVLEKKEATYQGSWKRSGGRSAWFMIKRLLDRLTTMVARPETPPGFSLADLIDALDQADESNEDAFIDTSILRYLQKCYIAENIFALVRSGPGGEDGTPLAVLRDIRRYLILVEAEMMSRKVVRPEMVDLDLILNRKKVGALEQVGTNLDTEPMVLRPNAYYLYTSPIGIKQYIARLLGWETSHAGMGELKTTCELDLGGAGYLSSVPVKQLMGPLVEPMDTWEPQHQKMRMEQWPPAGVLVPLGPVPGDENPLRKVYTSDGDLIYVGNFYRYREGRNGPEFAVKVEKIHDNGEVAIDIGQMGCQVVKPETLSLLPVAGLSRTPEDGAQAASLAPWVVDMAWRQRKGMEPLGDNREAFNVYWSCRATNLWVLEPAVSGTPPHGYAASVYLRQGDWYVLNISDCPADAREFFPYLEREMNTVTKDEQPSWIQNMYWWSEGETKWRLYDKFVKWARD
jgi:hypothetical protein